ncbi:uncharacterized protein C8R40DRAFT_1186733 [Lentinula edodes]|uniref:uncharacterized protein n=1 Tax=Lentinula edodes TaxID=5353 RepID=UPI001E8D0D81|nr:uncharacterized protein C8R40DRAFT_1186733 [Lentinula edodes]KAH7876165.1 hypothetical protein C8R40DRAFT_1186733 [Lentinula edodes]
MLSSVYIPELDRTFIKHPAFGIFAAQNPLSQRGGRKDLLKYFVNRFTKVYVDQLLPSDLRLVCQYLHPEVDTKLLEPITAFNTSLQHMVLIERSLRKEGEPYEFKLRDVLRWIGLLKRRSERRLLPVDHVRTVYSHCLRTSSDHHLALALFERTFGCSFDYSRNSYGRYSIVQ